MSGVKIINVLRGDTFSEILEHFRQAPVGEVIFVLPRAGKVFTREDHFSAFAAEAAGSGKLVSILSANSVTNGLARKYGFTVMSSSKPEKPSRAKAKPLAPLINLASAPLVGDPEVEASATYNDVPLTSDETMESVPDEDEETPEGFHIEGEEDEEEEKLPSQDADKELDIDADEPSDEDLGQLEEVSAPSQPIPVAHLAAAQVDGVRQTNAGKPLSVKGQREKAETLTVRPQQDADVDYLDAVWRSRQAPQDAPITASAPENTPVALPAMVALSRRWFRRPVMLGASLLLILMAGAAFFTKTGTASVVVEPTSESVELDIKVQASDMNTRIDAQLGKIPGQLIEISKTAEHSTPATGTRTVASKTRGRLTLSNDFSSAPQSLIATTRLLSADGKLFRTMQNVTIPGATVKSGTSVPGTVVVDVIADQPGPEYNVPAGKFRIAAFEEKGDTERSTKIYGTSTQAFSGGTNGPSSVATEDNITLATTTATQGVVDQIKTALTSQDSDFIALGIDTPTIDSIRKSAEADQASEMVSVTITGSVKTVAFRAKDLHQLVAEAILARQGKIVFPSQLTLEYKNPVFSSATGSLEFTVHVKGAAYHTVSTDEVKSSLQGKSSESAQEFFRTSANIKAATLKLSPFWARTVPESTGAIKVDLNYPTPSITPVDKAQ